ncbi:MAG: AtpZ/AtpI family protein [Deltaproteobacteria bacterium]|nr:AtpZ/AtpI family protein [Deltaproteobacteria bacterium]
MVDPNQTSEDQNRKGRNFALALGASQMGLFVAAGLLGGLWLDKKFSTSPFLGLVGLLLGFFSGISLLIRLVKSK